MLPSIIEKPTLFPHYIPLFFFLFTFSDRAIHPFTRRFLFVFNVVALDLYTCFRDRISSWCFFFSVCIDALEQPVWLPPFFHW